MKYYEVSIYNTADRFWDSYQVNATDPIDARNVAVQRLIDETGHGLDINEITDVHEIKDRTRLMMTSGTGRNTRKGVAGATANNQ